MSATVGFLALSELAKEMELAAKESDAETVHKLMPKLNEQIQYYREQLEPMKQAPKEDKPEKEQLEDMFLLSGWLEMMKYRVSQMDVDGANEIMYQIEKFAYDSCVQKQVDKVQKQLHDFELYGVNETVDGLLEYLREKEQV